jgi:HSP20 family protein
MSSPSEQEYLSALTDAVLHPEEGQLSIDVIERPDTIVIRSAIAGLAAKDLDVHVTHDTLTIRGKRHHGHEEQLTDTVHVQECFWGAFSRSILLPARVRADEAEAALKNGILTITLPKAEAGSTLPVIDLNEM